MRDELKKIRLTLDYAKGSYGTSELHIDYLISVVELLVDLFEEHRHDVPDGVYYTSGPK